MHQPVVDVELYRDIRPLLQCSCVACHTAANPAPPGRQVLDELTVSGGLPDDYRRLAADPGAAFGYPPVIAHGTWRQTNASLYVRPFQSRRSLLVWKLFGERLDGWTNADHPTESEPGNAAMLPPGTDLSSVDLDFTGTRMPPAGRAVPALTEGEKINLARWIDLGRPIDTGLRTSNAGVGWWLDDNRPTVEVSSPRAGYNAAPVSVVRVGLADAASGVSLTSLSITADFAVAGRPAGAELADLAVTAGEGIYEIALGGALPPLVRRHLRVSVRDLQGNVTRVDRVFSTRRTGAIFADELEWDGTLAWSAALGR